MNAFVVIPAYNEGVAVGDVVRKVIGRYPNVVVVNDGSADDTGETARQAGATVLTHLINRGQGAALKTGIDHALARGAEAVVTFDSDGQHMVEDIDLLLQTLHDRQVDVVLGSRFLRKDNQVPFLRRITLRLGVLFTRMISQIRVTDTHNGLRALSREAASKIQIRQDRMAHASEILDEIGRLKLRYCEVPVRVVYSEYSQQKGQRSSAAFRIVADFLIGKWEK